jgi:hypothetical protein
LNDPAIYEKSSQLVKTIRRNRGSRSPRSRLQLLFFALSEISQHLSGMRYVAKHPVTRHQIEVISDGFWQATIRKVAHKKTDVLKLAILPLKLFRGFD